MPRTSAHRLSRTWLVALVAVVLVGGAIGYGWRLGSPPAQAAKVEVPLVNLAGKPERVALSGRPTVVVFFAVWCPYCAYDARWVLPAFARKVRAQGGQVIAVDASPFVGQAIPGPLGHPDEGQDGARIPPPQGEEQSMSLAALRQYESTFHLPYPIYYDPGMHYSTAVQVPAFPSFLFYNAQGKAVAGLAGVQTEAGLWKAYIKAAQGAG